MPELPELTAHAERLHAGWAEARLERTEPLSFTALKTVDPPPEAAHDGVLAAVERRGKHLLLRVRTEADAACDLTFVVHLMQGGRLRRDAKLARRPRGGLWRWRFTDRDALLLTEAGTERRAGVWLHRGDPETAEPLVGLGPDADRLARDDLAARLEGQTGRVHTVLRDQRVLAGIGRRLANEVCHRAGLSPFARTDRLDAAATSRLAAVLAEAIADDLAVERERDALGPAAERPTRVHGRTGQPCPACGDVVREVAYRDYTIHYCAACQTGGKVLADNTTSRFVR